MPHIIIEYSDNVAPALDMGGLAAALHETLAAQGVDRHRIKTRAVLLPHSIVGEAAPNAGRMVHVHLALMEGRDVPTRKAYGQALYDALAGRVKPVLPDCSLTLEVREMVRETYFL